MGYHEQRDQRVRDFVSRGRHPQGEEEGLETLPAKPSLDLEAAQQELDALARTMPQLGLQTPAEAYQKVSLAYVHERLLRNEAVSAPELTAFEAIIIGKAWPVFRVRDGVPQFAEPDLALLPAPVRVALQDQTLRARLDRMVRAVARVNLKGFAAPYAGTAFLVGPDRLLTNRHVASLFADGVGLTIQMAEQLGPELAFGHEFSDQEPGAPQDLRGQRFAVSGIDWIHPYWDAALLRFDGADAPLFFLELDGAEPTDGTGRPVAVVGYPSFRQTGDPDYDDLQRLTFRGVFEVKRFQPGMAGPPALASFSSAQGTLEQRLIGHDCSTLGGNSGSALVDLGTGRVLGLHFYGSASRLNLAVPACELARDPRVRSRVTFAGLGQQNVPEWELLGGQRETPAEISGRAGRSARSLGTALGPAHAEAQPLRMHYGPTWYETAPDAAILRLLRDPAQGPAVLDELNETLGPEATSERLELLHRSLPLSASPFGKLVCLHGILGSHLVDVDSGDRAWLDPVDLALGRVDEALTLGPDGRTGLRGQRLSASGQLDTFYGRARRHWRAMGIDVVPMAYDWRRSIPELARELDQVIRTHARERPIVLAGHSMGGVIAAVWAAQSSDWKDLVSRVVLIGCPLRGSFAPVEYLSGMAPFLRLAASVAERSLVQLQTMAASFPGLLDLLPDPETFGAAISGPGISGLPGASNPDLFDVQTWRPLALSATSLQASLALKDTLRASPLPHDARTFSIVSDAWPTVAGWSANPDGTLGQPTHRESGDGVVPYRSAVPKEGTGRVFLAPGGRHTLLMNHTGVIELVAQICRGELPTAQGAPSGIVTRSAVPRGELALLGQDLRGRAQAGTFDPDDLVQLIDPGAPIVTEPPVCNDLPPMPELETAVPLTLSGTSWVSLFPGDRTTAGLIQPFRKKVQTFLTVLEAAGARIRINATRRPAERAYLMRYAWDIHQRIITPQGVPPMEGVPIQWDHDDDTASFAAARDMVTAYALRHRPSLRSRHIQGRAIDMNIQWTGILALVDGTGLAVQIDAVHGLDSNTVLHDVGRTFGVIKLVSDPPHWSDDGA